MTLLLHTMHPISAARPSGASPGNLKDLFSSPKRSDCWKDCPAVPNCDVILFPQLDEYHDEPNEPDDSPEDLTRPPRRIFKMEVLDD